MTNLVKSETQVNVRMNAIQSVEAIQSQISDIRRLMKTVMKEGVHYGTISGTKLPTLYKAGAELLIAYFGLSFRTIVDAEERDDEKYYVRIKSQLWKDDRLLGEAFGEASSQEEKYQWRAAVCDEEWDTTPEDKRRIAFKKWDRTVRKIKQVKVPVADISNTVLKMAVKRAMVAVVRMVCGASEVWTEDLEDMPQEIVESLVSDNAPVIKEPQQKVPSQPTQPTQPTQPEQKESEKEDNGDKYEDTTSKTITEKQRKRLFAIARKVNMPEEHLKLAVKHLCGVEHTKDINWQDYDTLCGFVENYEANLNAGVIDRWLAKEKAETANNQEKPF